MTSNLRAGFAALRHRNYRLYQGSQFISLIGSWMQAVSLPWLVLELGGSPLQLAAVVALQFGPATFLAPFGGVLADRIEKRKTLIVTEAAAMLQATVLFALVITGSAEVWHVLALTFLLGLVTAVDMPVRQAFNAELVPRDDLLNSIALNSASFNLARVVGPAIAGVVIALAGNGLNFALNAASYTAALIGLLLMDRAAVRAVTAASGSRVLASIAEGIRYARRTPTILWSLVLLAGIFFFAMNFSTLLPLHAHDVLKLSGDGYGALFACMGVGALSAALLLAYLGSRPILGLPLAAGAGFAVFEVLLGLDRVPLLAYPLMVGNGFCGMLMVNSLNGVVQWNVPDELRGRVMALWVTVFAGTVPVGAFFAGTVAQHWGSGVAFVIGGLAFGSVLAFVTWQLARHPGVALRRAPRLALEADTAP
jgi:MFS family permease